MSASLNPLIAQTFSRGADGYAHIRYFWHFGRRIAAHARLRPGQRVLDVACGRGASLFPAAEQVGPAGQAIAIDLAEEMVVRPRHEAAARGLHHVQVQTMSAEQLSFSSAAFDAVLCGFALPFFQRLGQALDEMRRVLTPGGRLVAATWGDDDARWAWLDDLLARYGAIKPLRAQALDTPASLARALRHARFTNVRVVAEETEIFFTSPDEWWSGLWSISARAGLEQLDAPALRQLQSEAFKCAEKLRQPGGLPFRLQALLGLAIS